MKKILLLVLAISFLVEAALTYICFFQPVKTFELFGMPYNEAYAYLGYLTAWFLLIVTLLVGFIIIQLYNNRDCKSLIYILGFWWIFLGIAVYLKFGKLDNLFLDTIKGVLMVVLNYLITRKKDKTA